MKPIAVEMPRQSKKISMMELGKRHCLGSGKYKEVNFFILKFKAGAT
jgi:hypothetical protein